ncbi:signal peptidase I [Shouchella lonarensis]|uniref:Signal peptidase I n=1 Tax=Shouchella lonarensis TaxID=1464122 RepID=A0A1G6GJD6_9BACI|nr:signal peptidase I [Shouchella lonarensis]SDB82121.1 signal peptidase I [Shouchella lonarensis]
MATVKAELWSWLKVIMVALLLTFVIRTFIMTSTTVKGVSMEPTASTGDRIFVNQATYYFGEPERFDVIVFKASEDADYIKRVIGLPGDIIRYEDDVLYVNDEAIPEPFLAEARASMVHGRLYTTDYVSHTVVPEGYVFVLGDNRRKSSDSRQLGFIDMNDIIGKAGLRFWPLDKMGFME